MHFHRLTEAPVSPQDVVFRPRGPAFFCVLLVVLIGLMIPALAACVRQGRSEAALVLGLLGTLPTVAVLVLLIRRQLYLLRPTSWVLRVSDERVLVRLRSLENDRLSPLDVQVVEVGMSEIAWVRPVDKLSYLDGGDGKYPVEEKHLDIAVARGELLLVAGLVAAERMRPAPPGLTKVQKYPVQVADGAIRVLFGRNLTDKLRPGLARAVALLGPHVPVRDKLVVTLDLSVAANQDAADRKESVLELVRTGQERKAVEFLRKTTSLSPADAQRAVEALRGV